MNAREILKQWLESNGYDGLCGHDCGCFNDDLVCCGEDPTLCEPGVRESQEDIPDYIVPKAAQKEGV
jgi:hypothetical protein